MAVDFNYFLGQKYALLAQQADADTQNAGTNAITGAAQAKNLAADAAFTGVKAALAPAETRSTIALQRSQGGLLDQQAAVVAPESAARIGQINAETGLTGIQGKVLTHNTLTGILGGPAGTPVPGALGGVFGARGVPGLGTLAPAVDPAIAAGATPTAQRLGESHDAWVARLRGAGY